MTESSGVSAVIAREGALARTAEEAERRAFDAASVSLADGQDQPLFSDAMDLSSANPAGSGYSRTSIGEGPSPFRHRGV